MKTNSVKKFLIILTAMAFMIAMVGMVNAATATLAAPASSSFHSTTMAVSCETTSTAVTNTTILYSLAGGANTSINIANTSADQTNFSNTVVDISGVTDSASYIWTCLVNNGVNVTYSASSTSVTLDSTNPTASAVLNGLRQVERMGSTQLKCQTGDAIDSSVTVEINLTKPQGGVVTTTNELNTFANGDLDELGDYTFRCTARDDSGNTQSSTQIVTVVSQDTGPSTRSRVVEAAQVVEDKGEVLTAVFLVLAVLVILIVGGLTTKKKKGKKRKRKRIGRRKRKR